MLAQKTMCELLKDLLEFLRRLILVAIRVFQQTLKEIQPEKQNILSTCIPLTIKNIQLPDNSMKDVKLILGNRPYYT